MKIDVMTKDKDTKTVVPALRFPEFRDAEGWRQKILSEILDYERPDNYIVSNANYCQQGTPVLTANKSFILGYTEEDYGICNNLPVVLFDDFTIDKKYVDFPFKVKSSAIKLLRTKNDDDLKFVFEMMSLIMFEAKEHKRYYISSYQNQNVYMPKPTEQIKIANCLGSLDGLISAVTDKIEALKEYKKGLMQQLFPAESKTTPAFRFPEFQNKGEWEEAILGDYVEIKGRIGYRGYTTNDIVEKGEGAISLSPTNITDNGELIFNKCTYISWGKYNESPEIMLDRGYVVLVKTGSSYGKSALVKQLPQKTTINPQIVILKPQKMNDVFLSLLISHNLIQKQINKAIVGGAIPTLSQDSISKFKILIPKIEEQKKIAEYLLSVDELISTETDKLDQLKAHKKGLMQQLFPKLQ